MIQNCPGCSVKNIKTVEDCVNLGLCFKCNIGVNNYNNYYNTNIPVNYWDLKMPGIKGITFTQMLLFDETIKSLPKINFNTIRDCAGNYFKHLLEIDKVYFGAGAEPNTSYINGLSFCLAGTHGVGKTLTVTNILKSIIAKKFTGLYTTLGDIVSVLTTASGEDKFITRKELTEVDFLVIDEFDSRFVATESAADLFGRTLEHILRSRLQNKLPIIMVSNSPNPVETFNGSLRESLGSLMNQVPLIPIIGEDFRKKIQ